MHIQLAGAVADVMSGNPESVTRTFIHGDPGSSCDWTRQRMFSCQPNKVELSKKMNSPRRSIVWFRRDLRLTDNSALSAAVTEADEVIPVFIYDPVGEHPWGPGAASRWWLHHSLVALDQSLRQRGSRLTVLAGDSEELISRLAQEVAAGSVHWSALYEPAAATLEHRCSKRLRQQGVDVQSHQGTLLHTPDKLLTAAGEPYRVFTPFWKNLRNTCGPGAALPIPTDLKPAGNWPETLDIDSLALLPRINWTEGMSAMWRPGESGARDRLDRFGIDRVIRYQADRDFPMREGISRLSPHLHFGEVSPRQVWLAVQARGGEIVPSASADAYCRQLAWREFAHHLLAHFPNSPEEPLQQKFRRFSWRKDYADLLAAWQRGQTGYPLVDAGMRELWATGWMHNRVRMVVASFLVKNLRIPWQEGARWFWDTLVDADLANNTMGWQWCAGCGADAAPFFRIFNPYLQAQKFDEHGKYVCHWVPELKEIPLLSPAYPKPLVDFGESRQRALDAYQQISA